MKILLCQDVKGIGWLGDIVEVKEGYGRNYLLPCGLGMIPTEGNVRSLAGAKAKRAEQRLGEEKRMAAAAAAVDGAEAVIAAKANEEGHLFGSVTARAIAANLREQGFEVADEIVYLSEHIKQVGSHKVSLRYSKDLVAAVNVVVVADGGVVTLPEDIKEQEGGEASEQDK